MKSQTIPAVQVAQDFFYISCQIKLRIQIRELNWL